MLGRIVREVTYTSRARGWRSSSNKNKNRSSYSCITPPESMASIDIEGTTTIVCGSWLNRSIDFHNGVSFFCKRSNSAGDTETGFDSGICQDTNFTNHHESHTI